MKLNTAGFLRKSQFPLMIALGLLPAAVLIVQHNAPEALGALSILVPGYVLAAWLCMLLPGKIRLPAGLAGCALLMATGFKTLPITQSVSGVDGSTVSVGQGVFTAAVPLLLCFLLLYSLRFAAWPHDREIAFNWYAAGVIAHLFILIVIRAARMDGSPAWEPIEPLLTAAFAAFLLLALLSMNRVTIVSASLGRQQAPPSMRRRNAVLTVAILLLTLFIAAFPAIARLLERTWSSVLHAVGSVIAWIARLLEPDALPSGGGAPGSGMLPLAAEAAQPGLLAKILELLATLISIAAVILFAAFAVRFLIRKAAALYRALRAHLARYMASASQDYIDEITDTREEGGETSGTLLERIRRNFAFVSERRLSPEARIRYRYRLLLRRHPDWHSSRTARENLAHSAAHLYEQARYSGQAMSGEQADQFAKDIKNA